MPIAKFKGVLICSSEDKNYPASNLLNNSIKKWKSEESGLGTVYVVLQLENPTKITGIDIGNENSVFIEVSVGRTGWPVDKFKTILVNHSFMSIIESRVSENPNRVRCFSKDALMPDVLEEKWDLVKVTCTQDINTHVQFGISFIKIHTSDAVSAASSISGLTSAPVITASPKEKKSCDEALGLPKHSAFAKFRIRNDSSDSDKESDASLFSQWKQKKDSPNNASSDNHNLSSAAAIREASSSMSTLEAYTKINQKIKTPTGKPKNPTENDDKDSKKNQLNRYRPALLYDDDDENTSKPKLEKLINQDKERIERERKQQNDKKNTKKNNTPREEKSKHKMESSAGKFKMFLSAENTNESPEKPETSSTNPEADDDIVEVKAQSPAKVDLTESSSSQTSGSQASGSGSGARALDSDSPPPFKPRNKRPPTSSESGSAEKRSKRSESPENNSSNTNTNQLLQGVVFVISGIQNPERGDLRGKGLELGGKYKPDWDDSCTHLICAFPNTPKYKQVRGQGIIVNKDWIKDCYARKQKLPWRDYEL